jgi:general secretion pathway protein H
MRQHLQTGFSLLELLLVLLIIGLLTGLSVAFLGRAQSTEADALEHLARSAEDTARQARHGGQILALGWADGRPVRLRLLPQGQVTRWQREPLALANWPAGLQPRNAREGLPWVVFTPSGIAAPATLEWSWENGSERWRWQSDGRLLTQAQP